MTRTLKRQKNCLAALARTLPTCQPGNPLQQPGVQRRLHKACRVWVQAAFEKAVHAPEGGTSLAKLGVEPGPLGTPAQFSAMVSADSRRWAGIIHDR